MSYGTFSTGRAGILRHRITITNPSTLVTQNSFGEDVIVSVTTMLSLGINATVTTIPVVSGAGFLKGDYLQIGTELMLITDGAESASLIVTRGYFGTAPVPHLMSSLVTNATEPVIGEFPAQVLPLGGTEVVVAGQRWAKSMFQITMRHQPGITFSAKNNIIWNKFKLDILNINDPGEGDPWITISAREVELSG